jgi:hypothetical protein
VKDELCFVSLDLHRDLQAAKSFRRNQVKGSFPSCDPLGDPLKRFFVLPDYHKIKVGYVKPLDEPVTESEQVNDILVNVLVGSLVRLPSLTVNKGEI